MDLTRRRLAQWAVALFAAPHALAALPPPVATAVKLPFTLHPDQLPIYKKELAGQAREAASLRRFPLGYGYEPDFVFSALPARPARRRRGHSGTPA